jgi:ketosteroid isomerase-like protein
MVIVPMIHRRDRRPQPCRAPIRGYHEVQHGPPRWKAITHLEEIMTVTTWATGLFQDIDRQDADAFASRFATEGSFQFGNVPPVKGRQAVREMVAGFFGSIAGLRHDLTDTWEVPGGVVVVGEVTYTRHDGTELRVPFTDVLRLRDDEVTHYQIYIDSSLLYQAG